MGSSAFLGFICTSVYPALSRRDHPLRHLHRRSRGRPLLGRCTCTSSHHQSRRSHIYHTKTPPPSIDKATSPSQQHGALHRAVRPTPGGAVCRSALFMHMYALFLPLVNRIDTSSSNKALCVQRYLGLVHAALSACRHSSSSVSSSVSCDDLGCGDLLDLEARQTAERKMRVVPSYAPSIYLMCRHASIRRSLSSL
jgi:hypothetical protein